MKSVLIVIDGDIGREFLSQVINKHYSSNNYVVLSKTPLQEDTNLPSTFSFYECDYTSTFRLDQILGSSISDIFLLLDDLEEKKIVYNYMRERYKNARIVSNFKYAKLCDYSKDTNLIIIEETNALASKLLARLPNAPSVPRGFGLEQGEIMEIGVPTGSIYTYRQIGSIEQKDWKIVGIYRAGKFLLAQDSFMIKAGDVLLVVGEPKVLTSIFNHIKSDIGQFPLPFGHDVYLYIDMLTQSKESILYAIEEALFVHNKLKSFRLYINVFNTCDFKFLKEIKAFDSHDVKVNIEHSGMGFKKLIESNKSKKIGLIIVSKEIFSKRGNRKALHACLSPVLKLGSHSMKEVKESLVIINGTIKEGNNLSSVIFDVSKQLDLKIKIYDYEPDGHFEPSVEEGYQNVARIYNKKIRYLKVTSKNPLFHLKTLKVPVFQFMPFTKAITKTKAFAFFKTNIEALSFLLDNNPQIFIPIVEDL
ncbi:TrkA C-terminal domain-containing protein [Helicobacter sp. 11S02629-2]|uniref:TrkA C-terminal domain-containing protein n=1 Tax=Helicobacter sp. 11S02629-2 TaxID=1476195 RepID=UPI000BA62E1D|nr:TrkA C-terminal domain-containing protein [Helicobacter sp. 11S02629-2]PAF44372.1 hypothetical protein BKH40_05610 [Helicobacter sp. 11S02629-2]